MTGVVVRVAEARKAFGARVVLDGFDLEIRAGEFVALLGTSGSGKTTLLRTLSGLDALDSGEILVPQPCTVVFQEPRLVPSKRIIDNVRLGLGGGQATAAQALAALDEVGLTSHARSWPAVLSGGEAQRVALARALVRAPKLLLLDEPFGALDALTRLKMQSLVADLCARHRPAVLLVTHDVDEAILLADRILVLSQGRATVDLTVDLPRPRIRQGAGHGALRARLLTALGVDEGAGADGGIRMSNILTI